MNATLHQCCQRARETLRQQDEPLKTAATSEAWVLTVFCRPWQMRIGVKFCPWCGANLNEWLKLQRHQQRTPSAQPRANPKNGGRT